MCNAVSGKYNIQKFIYEWKKGFSSIEYDSQEEIKSDQFEDPEKVTPEEREKLRDDVTDAMAEADTIDEEPSKEESSEKKDQAEKEGKVDKDAEKEKPKEETKAEEPKKDEEKMETEDDKKAEEKPEEAEKAKDSKPEEKSDTKADETKVKLEKIFVRNNYSIQPEEDSMAEDPDAIPSMQLAWEMIELARVIYKQREEVNKYFSIKFIFMPFWGKYPLLDFVMDSLFQSMERDIKISECYLRLGEIGLENENYTGAIGDLLECQVLQKQHFDKLDRRIAETHYHLGSAYSFEKRYNNAKEHFEAARKVIIDKIDKLTEEFDAESEKESSDEKLMSEKTNEIAQLKDILPDLNSKLEDIECSIKNEKFNKVQEHLDEKVTYCPLFTNNWFDF